ncbi:MAG: hypothetical protein NZM38_10260 [Cytophagales bacterium]|nr:hypothetical protein [Cytophagales bacterium]MDW8385136.1 hypothetical protein [Flammeovirgaceae bacterium]
MRDKKEIENWLKEHTPLEIISSVADFVFLIPRLSLALIFSLCLFGLGVVFILSFLGWRFEEIVICFLLTSPFGLFIAAWFGIIVYVFVLFHLLKDVLEKTFAWAENVFYLKTAENIQVPNFMEVVRYIFSKYLLEQFQKKLSSPFRILIMLFRAVMGIFFKIFLKKIQVSHSDQKMTTNEKVSFGHIRQVSKNTLRILYRIGIELNLLMWILITFLYGIFLHFLKRFIF